MTEIKVTVSSDALTGKHTMVSLDHDPVIEVHGKDYSSLIEHMKDKLKEVQPKIKAIRIVY